MITLSDYQCNKIKGSSLHFSGSFTISNMKTVKKNYLYGFATNKKENTLTNLLLLMISFLQSQNVWFFIFAIIHLEGFVERGEHAAKTTIRSAGFSKREARNKWSTGSLIDRVLLSFYCSTHSNSRRSNSRKMLYLKISVYLKSLSKMSF